ncbi:uncharacterized protein LOC135095938 [Scylla paramamosain]|uniref:uncharacterized protein LOC135095938 n=1 Tax=Scylla paramamosain TaxID=85552 RepID=UPI00308366B9
MTGPLGAGSGCCPDCCGVYYCCHDHLREDREQHRQWCELYKLCSCCNQQAKNREAITLPTALDQEYRPLAPAMEEHILSLASRLRPVAVTGASESLTFPLTALYVLQQVWPGLATAPVLTLHVVGAEDGREPRVAAPWEYLMHRLPVLARLHVLLVGPGMGGPQGCHRAALCQQCRDKDRQLVVECRRALYHNLPQATAAATPPATLRLAFNCGFHEWEGDTWPDSLFLMADDAAPLAFTSFNHSEAQRDLAALRRAKPEVQVSLLCPNPYRSTRPLQDWTREDGAHMYYTNQYLTVLQAGQAGQRAAQDTGEEGEQEEGKQGEAREGQMGEQHTLPDTT